MALPFLVIVAVILLAIAAFGGGSDEGGATDDGAASDDAGADDAATEDGATDDAAVDDAADRAVPDDESDIEGSDASPPDAADEELDEIMSLLERREPDDPLAMGDVDAPVLMIEWADFQCPFCGTFARDTKPELIERFVDTGVLRIEWWDHPVLGEESLTAALAGRAAAQQDAFWALHDEIFAEERPRDAGHLDRDAMVAMAEDLGLDAERFAEDLDDPAHLEAVQADQAIAQQLGITGTPTFLIDGQPVIGGQPTDVFVQIIEDAAGSDAP